MTDQQPVSPRHKFADIRTLSVWLQWMLAASAVLAIIAIVSGLMERSVLNALSAAAQTTADETSANGLMAAAEQSDFRQMIVGYSQIALYIITAIVFATWIYAASRNCHAVSSNKLEYSPGWSIGWFFIPIFNLFKPYMAMRQTWNISGSPQGQPDAPGPVLLKAWWLLFLFENSAARIAFRMGSRAEELSDILDYNLATLFADTLSVPACIAGFLVVKNIAAKQANTMSVNFSAASLSPLVQED